MKKYIIEFIGTFFLVLTIGLTGNPLAIGAVLIAMVYMGGYISGAHYNPAITLAVWLQKKLPTTQMVIYMLVQLAAALAAAGVFHAMHGGNIIVSPGAGVSFGAALLTEILFTFALVSVVLHTALSKETKGNQYYGLAIGFTLMVAAFAGGQISGGAFNPVVGLGPNLFDGDFSNIGLYLAGPLAGGALASLVFKITNEKTVA